MNVNKKKFQWRAFITFSIVFAFLVILVSGIILYVAPPGRIANWSRWTIVALTKSQWQAVHTVFAALFVIIALFHVYFNWKVILSNVRKRIADGMSRRRELAFALSIGIVIVMLVLTDAPPFSTFMDLGEDLKNSWATSDTEPPRPHAELQTLIAFAQTAQIPLEDLTSRLGAAGLEPDSMEMTIASLAQKYHLSPQQLYGRIKVERPTSDLRGGSGGYGRKRVAEVCRELDVPLETALERLRSRGIAATGESSLRDIALETKLTPRDVATIIRPETAQ
jgi:hypothetical protein